MLNKLVKILAEAKVKTLDDTQGDVDCEALIDTSADTLLKVKTDLHRDIPGQVWTKALINMLYIALQEVKPKNLW